MVSKDDKYQNILAQMHELNRQNLLNENERNEQLNARIEYLTQIIETKSEKVEETRELPLKKILYGIIALTVINAFLSLFILFGVFSSNNSENISPDTTQLQIEPKNLEEDIVQKKEIELKVDENQKNEQIEENLNQNAQEDILVFSQEKIEEQKDESFEEIKPIIKKDTIYSCKDDNYTKIYKIPYTVEIKGKLYTDRFVFIMQNNSGTKECMINKNDM